jgi:phosphopantothenoylcysteine decarboxylase/phosphopantothenate--cysteine ligase
MRILITAGPTREYLDDVRYLSNASSGRMGYAIAEAALAAGHSVVLVSGPVAIPPPAGCEAHPVETTTEMFAACLQLFPDCDGVIAAAAVCDYAPRLRKAGKIDKTGQPLLLELVETPDILAELGRRKEHRWNVGFALEAEAPHARAVRKLHKKNCDAILLNSPSAIGAESSSVELIDRSEQIVAQWSGTKSHIARELLAWIETRFNPSRSQAKA